ncbi:MAG: alpha-glucosidase [Firmicutes bacterium]|nr:alpha-glucosidase [Bacillota bacterium]
MLKWWQERVVYQIYPRSFKDTNDDGIGDLQGIIAQLDYLADLGVGIIWLSPVYPSPNVDYGYDISDYKAIHPEFGTMADMEQLLAEAEKRDIKIVMDLVINHTSDQHPWFQKSRAKVDPYTDYYIWRPGQGKKPPNNWTGFFGGGTWQYDEVRGEYYLHLFAKNQPDLNYHNPKVIQEVMGIMRFWLEKGVAGFRCDVINILYKSSLANGKPRLILTGSEHYLTQEGTHEILRTLRRDVLDHFPCFTVGETVFVTPQDALDLMEPSRGELDMVFSFEHMETDQYIVKWFKRRFHAGRFARSISKWQNALPWNANYLENHDQPRSVSRFGDDGTYWEKSAKLLCMMLLSLRGTPFIYQGQEIGMTNFDFASMADLKDVESHNIDKIARRLGFPQALRWKMMQETSRDNARTPMQWNSGKHGGFTESQPWLAVNKNYTTINVASQLDEADSIRAMYKKMIALRAQSEVLQGGTFEAVEVSRDFFAYRRKLGERSLLVLLNFAKKNRDASFAGATLVLSNYDRKVYDGKLQPYEAVILKES